MYFPEESNRYGLGVLPDRDALVAHAAGNDIIRVLPPGDVTTMARFDPVAMVGFHQHQRADGVGILCGIELRKDPTEREPDQRVRLFSSDCCEHGLKVVYHILGGAGCRRCVGGSRGHTRKPECRQADAT
jgi:hypothetical protein